MNARRVTAGHQTSHGDPRNEGQELVCGCGATKERIGEETARNIEMYLAVTALYFVSAFAVNRVMLAVEARVRVPGMIGGK